MSGKGGDALGNIIMILVGIGMIVFASSCFKDLPIIGTVYLMPGDNIMNAKIADPKLRYALFLAGGAFTAFGIFMQVRTGFCHNEQDASQSSAGQRSATSTGINLSGIKDAKDLLDSGAISEEEFNRIKEKLIK